MACISPASSPVLSSCVRPWLALLVMPASEPRLAKACLPGALTRREAGLVVAREQVTRCPIPSGSMACWVGGRLVGDACAGGRLKPRVCGHRRHHSWPQSHLRVLSQLLFAFPVTRPPFLLLQVPSLMTSFLFKNLLQPSQHGSVVSVRL